MAKAKDPRLERLWRQRLARFNPDRQTVAQFCDDEDVSVATYYYWRRRLAAGSEDDRPAQPAHTTPLFVSARVPLPSGDVVIEVGSQVRVRVPATAEASTIGNWLTAAAAASLCEREASRSACLPRCGSSCARSRPTCEKDSTDSPGSSLRSSRPTASVGICSYSSTVAEIGSKSCYGTETDS